jgi:hypothetical protein
MTTDLTVATQSQHVFANAQSFETAQRIAGALSKASLVPKEYLNNLPNCLIALEIAQRTGASPLLVMQNLYIVHGKPSWSSQFIISAINSCGRFKPLRFDLTGKSEADERTCVAWTVERNVELPADVGTLEQARAKNVPVLESPPVSIKIAKAEGWFDKNGSKWKTMPELMLRYRAATFFGRLYAPEILMGMRTEDESHDMVDVTPPESTILTNLNEAIKAQEEAVTDVAETAEVVEEKKPEPEVKLKLTDWLKEITAMPTIEGVEFKHKQAAEQFSGDTIALGALNTTKDKRIAAIKKEAA